MNLLLLLFLTGWAVKVVVIDYLENKVEGVGFAKAQGPKDIP